MKMQHVRQTATLLLVCSCLTACYQQAAPGTTAPAAPAAVASAAAAPKVVVEQAPVCNACGVVRSVTAVTQEGRATGAGAVIGGIVGGVAGNQVGGGSGRQIATVAGVIGGAVLGNEIEQNRNTASWYEIEIDMEGGGQQFITVPDASGISPGARVTVQGSNITLR